MSTKKNTKPQVILQSNEFKLAMNGAYGVKGAFSETLNTLIPVNAIQNVADFRTVMRTLETADDKLSYKKARAIAIANEKKLYEQADEKTLVDFIKKQYGISRTQVYNYIKASKLIDENAEHSIFTTEKVFADISVTKLVSIAEYVIDENGEIITDKIDTVSSAFNCGRLTAFMTVKELEKDLKKLFTSIDIDEDGNAVQSSEQTESEQAESEQTESEQTESEQTEKPIKVSYYESKLDSANSRKSKFTLENVQQGNIILVIYDGKVTKAIKVIGEE